MISFKLSHGQWSIRGKILIALVFMSVLSLLLTATIALQAYKSQIDEEVTSRLSAMQSIQQQRIEGFINQTDERLRLIASRTQLRLQFKSYLSKPDEKK